MKHVPKTRAKPSNRDDEHRRSPDGLGSQAEAVRRGGECPEKDEECFEGLAACALNLV